MGYEMVWVAVLFGIMILAICLRYCCCINATGRKDSSDQPTQQEAAQLTELVQRRMNEQSQHQTTHQQQHQPTHQLQHQGRHQSQRPGQIQSLLPTESQPTHLQEPSRPSPRPSPPPSAPPPPPPPEDDPPPSYAEAVLQSGEMPPWLQQDGRRTGLD